MHAMNRQFSVPKELALCINFNSKCFTCEIKRWYYNQISFVIFPNPKQCSNDESKFLFSEIKCKSIKDAQWRTKERCSSPRNDVQPCCREGERDEMVAQCDIASQATNVPALSEEARLLLSNFSHAADIFELTEAAAVAVAILTSLS